MRNLFHRINGIDPSCSKPNGRILKMFPSKYSYIATISKQTHCRTCRKRVYIQSAVHCKHAEHTENVSSFRENMVRRSSRSRSRGREVNICIQLMLSRSLGSLAASGFLTGIATSTLLTPLKRFSYILI